jgi:3-phosphoshikimate 1-carboxyvinyltransferase
MGVPIEASAEGTAPLILKARPSEKKLDPLDETLPVASAQVKSCLLLAALAAEGETCLVEPGPSRDHTERMLNSMGAQVTCTGYFEGSDSRYETRLLPPAGPLSPIHLALPGDISSAAFLLVAGLVVPGSEIRVPGVGLNPTRTGLVDALLAMGADLRVEKRREQAGEPVGDLIVRTSRLHGINVSGPLVVRMIDEFSAFGIAAACAHGRTQVRDAAELRLKESDRIHTLCQELEAIGVQAEEFDDGFTVEGVGRVAAPGSSAQSQNSLLGGETQSHGDHRLAMAMTVAGMAGIAPLVIHGAEMIEESFPSFVETLKALGGNLEMAVEESV